MFAGVKLYSGEAVSFVFILMVINGRFITAMAAQELTTCSPRV